MREVCSCPLHHEFEGRIRWDVVQVVPPQNAASLAVNPKELNRKEAKDQLYRKMCVSNRSDGVCLLVLNFTKGLYDLRQNKHNLV